MKGFILRVLPDALLLRIKKFHYVRSLRTFTETDAAVLIHLVKRGDTVVDIGANVGWYTKILSELVGESGRVHSIEPIPPTFELLSHCVRKLHLRNVRLVKCAISANNGTATMEVPVYASGGENYYQGRIITEPKTQSLKRFNVRTSSMDFLFRDTLSNISFVKCDVEGHEAAVITGAGRLIEHAKPSWLIEISGDPDKPTSEAYQIFRYMEKQGYGGYWFDGEALHSRHPGERSINYFFLTDRHLQSIRTSGLKVTR
jgi:FkbM family methyltransferase